MTLKPYLYVQARVFPVGDGATLISFDHARVLATDDNLAYAIGHDAIVQRQLVPQRVGATDGEVEQRRVYPLTSLLNDYVVAL